MDSPGYVCLLLIKPEPKQTAKKTKSLGNWSLVHVCLCGNLRFLALQELPGAEPDSEDVVLVTKQFMCSDRLSGPPLLLCPATRIINYMFSYPVPKEVLPRNAFSEEQAKQYLKTAKVVARPPWNLDLAAEYLKGLVERNKAKGYGTPPELRFVAGDNYSAFSKGASFPEEWDTFAPGTPAAIVVKPVRGDVPGPVLKRRRLAAKTDVEEQPSAGLRLGCTKCRNSKRGCARCKKLAAAAAVAAEGEQQGDAGLPVDQQQEDEPVDPPIMAE